MSGYPKQDYADDSEAIAAAIMMGFLMLVAGFIAILAYYQNTCTKYKYEVCTSGLGGTCQYADNYTQQGNCIEINQTAICGSYYIRPDTDQCVDSGQ